MNDFVGLYFRAPNPTAFIFAFAKRDLSDAV